MNGGLGGQPNNMMSVTMMPPPNQMMMNSMMPPPNGMGFPPGGAGPMSQMQPAFYPPPDNGGMFRANPSFIPYIILTPESPENPRIEMEVTSIIRVGRASETASRQNDGMITYRSRVISRHHAELWSDEKGEVRKGRMKRAMNDGKNDNEIDPMSKIVLHILILSSSTS